ncbi:hypothetical protein DIC66_13770 [Rhodoferax lacus]|uniref:Uncharacterized protein n=1 Tax=Rhodoferax lacus TaxID=2184758 RepID=A0A3E1RAX9_9BURK|nr:hypothetical protein [Rhodoferax lacus]RFO96371.1 hypothetical protein DIC66_13770 [Rhodoferax lacus]
MQHVNPTPAAVEAFQQFYLAELDSRVQRSEVVGAITLKKGSAALFFEPTEGKFTLVEKMPDVEEANVFDCVPREQWGRTVMLFGHATNTGGYIASGHATLDANTIKIKLATGAYYRLDVDGTLAHLQPFVGEPINAKPEPARQEKRTPARSNKPQVRQFEKPAAPRVDASQQVNMNSRTNEECEDLTEDDLRRLRGEMPVTAKSRKKWQH